MGIVIKTHERKKFKIQNTKKKKFVTTKTRQNKKVSLTSRDFRVGRVIIRESFVLCVNFNCEIVVRSVIAHCIIIRVSSLHG